MEKVTLPSQYAEGKSFFKKIFISKYLEGTDAE